MTGPAEQTEPPADQIDEPAPPLDAPLPGAPKPTIVEVVDAEGRTHWTANGSEAHEALLAEVAESSGPTAPGEVAADAGSEVPAQADDPDAGSTEDGPDDAERAAGSAGGGKRARVPRAGTGS